MIKVVCGTITGVVSLINIVTMLYALMHSNSLQDGNPPTYLISIISWNANGLIFRIYILAKPEYPNGLIIELCTLIIISKTEGFSPKS